MKRLIFIFAFLLCCSAIQANARGIMTMCGAGVPVAGCTTPTGDELTESFGDASTSCWSGGDSLCNNTWTVTTGTPTIANVPAGAPDNTACTKGLYYDATSAAVNIRKDIGDGTIPNNVQLVTTFTFYVDASSVAAYGNNTILSLTASTSMVDSSNYFFVRLYNTTGSAGTPNKFGCAQTGALDFSLDTWYSCTITLDSAGAASGSSLVCNGNTQTFTRGTSASRYLWAGSSGAGTEAYIGNVRLSTP